MGGEPPSWVESFDRLSIGFIYVLGEATKKGPEKMPSNDQMSSPRQPTGDITVLLRAWEDGDSSAFDRLVPLIYKDLRHLAQGQLRHHAAGWTLNATGLVHEAYLRLLSSKQLSLNDRGHFMAVAARAMRQVVIEQARRHSAKKRDSGGRPATLDEGLIAVESQAEWLLSLNQALGRLAARRPRMMQVVECRYFAGLSIEDTAKALGTSSRTVKREWTFARSWLLRELDPI